MVGSEYTVCPMCGGEDGQGCYKDCPSEELPRLRAEIERLWAALEQVVAQDDQPACCGKGIWGQDGPECCGQPEYGIDRAQNIARAALAAQPAPGKEEA